MKQLQIGENDAEQRLDKFLKKLLKNASISYIYKLNRKGNIKVNKKKKPNEYILELDDEVKVFLSDEEYFSLVKQEKKPTQNTNKQSIGKKDIVHEDRHLLVVNKKPGVIVHPGDFKTKDISLIEQVHDYLENDGWGLTFKPSLVHRIDKETSGIVLIAKQKQLLTQLVSDFKTHKNLTKTYRVFVFGELSRKSGTIKKKLLRIENASNENKIQISEKGQTAVTHYTLKNSYSFDTGKNKVQVHELEVTIETGRMHQIRVHMTSLGNPIVGDSKYGNIGLNSYVKRHFSISRQLLHAYSLSIFNSLEKKEMTFTAPLQEDMKIFKDKLTKIS